MTAVSSANIEKIIKTVSIFLTQLKLASYFLFASYKMLLLKLLRNIDNLPNVHSTNFDILHGHYMSEKVIGYMDPCHYNTLPL